MPALPARASLLVVLVSLLAAACEQEGYRLELSIEADDAGALVAGARVDVQLRDRQTRSGTQLVSVTLDRAVGGGDALPIAIELNGGGAYDAHVTVDAPSGLFYATRCYSIGGTEKSAVLVSGPLDDTTDEDGDGWPVEDDCRDPGGAPCDHPCPPLRALDCNELEPDVHPGAPDICQDQIDQDCSGTDALCGEDEGPDA